MEKIVLSWLFKANRMGKWQEKIEGKKVGENGRKEQKNSRREWQERTVEKNSRKE